MWGKNGRNYVFNRGTPVGSTFKLNQQRMLSKREVENEDKKKR
jgi:hypothetical protein